MMKKFNKKRNFIIQERHAGYYNSMLEYLSRKGNKVKVYYDSKNRIIGTKIIWKTNSKII